MTAKPLIILALALSMQASLLAQNDGPPPRGPGGGRHRPPPMPIITALDTNKDHVISADEIANAPAALKTLDKNGDGQLTRDEYMPPHHGPGGPDGPPPGSDDSKHHRPVPPIIAALDTNGDGLISADEIANASASLLKLDKNGDGQLTMDELRPARPEGAPGEDHGPDDGQRPPPPSDDKN